MDYWLLIAFVFSLAFAILFLQKGEPRPAYDSIAIGFGLLALSLALQLVLRFELQDWAARGFYWARMCLILAWFGLGAQHLTWPQRQELRWLTIGLVIASLVTLILVVLAPITQAQDWFAPSQPVYGQLDDLLATNRPLRWSALALNVSGAAGLFVGAFVALMRHPDWMQGLRFAAILAGAVLLLPIYPPGQQADALFFLREAAAPFLVFIGLNVASVSEAKPAKRKKKR